MLGGFLALLSAATFGLNTAIARRGVLNGSVLQALAVTVPLGFVIFAAIIVAGGRGAFSEFGAFSLEGYVLLVAAGILHFIWSRYCTYRATKAMGGNLAGPVQQLGLVITLGLAIAVLDERLTPIKALGIVLVFIGPIMMLGGRRKETAAIGKPAFLPDYREGYLFAILSTLGASVSPVLIRFAMPENASIWSGIAAGTISYVAAMFALGIILILPGRAMHVGQMSRSTAVLFTASGVAVSISQLFRYMALAIAPVTVVTPIQRTAIVFRMGFARFINPEHEVFTARMMIATALSLAGALLLSLSTDIFAGFFADTYWEGLVSWQWP